MLMLTFQLHPDEEVLRWDESRFRPPVTHVRTLKRSLWESGLLPSACVSSPRGTLVVCPLNLSGVFAASPAVAQLIGFPETCEPSMKVSVWLCRVRLWTFMEQLLELGVCNFTSGPDNRASRQSDITMKAAVTVATVSNTSPMDTDFPNTYSCCVFSSFPCCISPSFHAVPLLLTTSCRFSSFAPAGLTPGGSAAAPETRETGEQL